MRNPDNLLSKDALRHAVAFKGNSAQLLHDALDEVDRLSRNGEIYPPKFPTAGDRFTSASLTNIPYSSSDAPLNAAEATGAKVLLDETSVLQQNTLRRLETTYRINEALELPGDGSQTDAIDSMSDFGIMLGIAARVREKVKAGKKPKRDGWSIQDDFERYWHEKLGGSLEADGLEIGENTARAIRNSIIESATQHIKENPEGAKTEREISARISSKMRGADVAENLYLEAKGIAANFFK